MGNGHGWGKWGSICHKYRVSLGDKVNPICGHMRIIPKPCTEDGL